MKVAFGLLAFILVVTGCGVGGTQGKPGQAGGSGAPSGTAGSGGGTATQGLAGQGDAPPTSGDGGAGGFPVPADADVPIPDARTGFDAGAPDASLDSSAVDPGADGDGTRMLAGPYKAAPEYARQAGVPQGKLLRFTMDQVSAIYPKAPTTRKIAVYVPRQYVAGTPAAALVVQDGTDFYGFDTSIPTVLDNLIAKGAIPPLVAVFVGNGGGDYIGSERGLEYDTVSGLYAEWVETEVFPRVERQTTAELSEQAVTFTKDPEGRAAMGGSSGGAASFSMAWWRPDLFRRVIAFSGTFVNQVAAGTPFPHGCWIYHDKDPYDAAEPNGLIVAHCESATGAGTSNVGPCDTPLSRAACEAVAGCAWNATFDKPLRVWLESGTNDNGATSAPSTYRNFDLANQRMAAALARRGYHHHYDRAQGAGHVDQGPLKQTLPEALTWLWRGYVAR